MESSILKGLVTNYASTVKNGIACLRKGNRRRRRPQRYKFEFLFVRNDRPLSQKSGTRRENRNAPDQAPDLSPFNPDDRGYPRFRVFSSQQNLRRSGNGGKIPDRHMKTRLNVHPRDTLLNMIYSYRYAQRPTMWFFEAFWSGKGYRFLSF